MKATLLLLLLLAACSPPRDASCPNDLPSACPAAVPSYQTAIDPIIGNRCRSCHAPGGLESSHPLTTHQQIFSERSTILNLVYDCRMPPAGSPAPTAEERMLLLGWLVCGAPDN